MGVEAALVGCMDEHQKIGDNTAKFGLVASGVTREKTGNQEVYPDGVREIVERARGPIIDSLKAIASRWNVKLGVTSHPGCGGGAAQAIGGEEILDVTKNMCRKIGVEYYGHVSIDDEPLELTGTRALSSMVRNESDHHHTATGVVVTIGGGITGQEKDELTTKHGGDFFDVSADWIHGVLDAGISEEDAYAILRQQVLIALAIADGVRENNSPVFIYNAGRIEDQNVVVKNESLATRLMAEFNGQKTKS